MAQILGFAALLGLEEALVQGFHKASVLIECLKGLLSRGFGVWVPVLGTYYESQRCIVLIETFD